MPSIIGNGSSALYGESDSVCRNGGKDKKSMKLEKIDEIRSMGDSTPPKDAMEIRNDAGLFAVEALLFHEMMIIVNELDYLITKDRSVLHDHFCADNFLILQMYIDRSANEMLETELRDSTSNLNLVLVEKALWVNRQLLLLNF
ncbi:hypothetical protein HHK36_016230 [Tetracentron sinense]|uniref:Uncharacterized protein n=1 Tax=Tetracentron sinense TaxID=13715 RepID=A0A834YZX9_TETSI|nr:hypothetical protein HHK36_016230 [Tetracentron sinense]